jgi:hypothetical protein
VRRERPASMHADSWGMPAPGLPASALQIEQLAPGEGGSVSPGKAMRREPGQQILAPGDGIVRPWGERLKLCKEGLRVGAGDVSGTRHLNLGVGGHVSTHEGRGFPQAGRIVFDRTHPPSKKGLSGKISDVDGGTGQALMRPMLRKQPITGHSTKQPSDRAANALLLPSPPVVVVYRSNLARTPRVTEPIPEGGPAYQAPALLGIVDDAPLLRGDPVRCGASHARSIPHARAQRNTWRSTRRGFCLTPGVAGRRIDEGARCRPASEAKPG